MRALERRYLRIDGGIGSLIGRFGDDHVGLLSQAILETFQIVLPVVVVLVEDGYLRGRMIRGDVLAVCAPFELIARVESHGPGIVRGIAPARGAGRSEELRHLLRIEIPLNRR